jgi:hypothetical protein
MDIKCPFCDHHNELDGDDLPSDACDSKLYECDICDQYFLIGWYATAELR